MAYYSRPCESYFVESHEDHERLFREKCVQEHEHRNREVQFAIAEELSQLASEEYRDDILTHMEKMEVKNLDVHDEAVWLTVHLA